MILSVETDKRLTQGGQHAQQQDPQHVCSLSGLSALLTLLSSIYIYARRSSQNRCFLMADTHRCVNPTDFTTAKANVPVAE